MHNQWRKDHPDMLMLLLGDLVPAGRLGVMVGGRLAQTASRVSSLLPPYLSGSFKE